DLDPVQARANRLEMLRPPWHRNRSAMRTLQDPAQVGILRWIELDRGMIDAAVHVLSELAIDMIEEGRIATQPSHDGVGEEQLEQKPPTHIVPASSDELRALLARTRYEDLFDRAATVHQRQQPSPHDPEIPFELADATQSMGNDIVLLATPESLALRRQ